MDIQPITCSGINSQLKVMQMHIKKINNMLYDMGYEDGYDDGKNS